MSFGQIDLIAISKGGGAIIFDIREVIKVGFVESGNNEQLRCEFGLAEAFGLGDGELHFGDGGVEGVVVG
jgi:hypothetical protein